MSDDKLSGVIRDFKGTHLSAMSVLVIEDDDGGVHKIECANFPTVCAFQDMFGGVVMDGRGGVDVSAIIGKRIEYWLSDTGVLAGLVSGEEEMNKDE